MYISRQKRTKFSGMFLCLLMLGVCTSLQAAQAKAKEREPKEQVQVVKPVTGVRSALGISYPEGTTLGIKFQGTHRLPGASGEAKIERKKGMTEIEIEIDEIKPATYFGGDFSTYVLWTVSPEGHVDNAGEFIVQGNRGKLNVSTPQQTFGMFITAEPHFLVETPSTFVVMENLRPAREVSGGIVKSSTITYRGFEGVYNYHRETLADLKESKGEVRTDMKQAVVAVELAKRAGTEEHAPEAFSQAQESLDKTILAVEDKVGTKQVMVMAHETVRLAVKAQKEAEDQAFQAALDAERQAHSDEISEFEGRIDQAKSEAERERLKAEQRQMQLEMEQRARERALADAREAARRAAEEARRRLEAEQKARQAEQEAQLLASAKREAVWEARRARDEAERANREREEARARMQMALSKIVETRENARGIIINLPDILFDFDKASLRPQAREVLSKVCGILLVAEGYELSVEGHTDSVGTDEYNHKLSEDRARSVHGYLDQCGLPTDIISTKGFGESQPVASNETAEGRQKNRRVEIVIEDSEGFRLSAVQ